jgi:hypothetical protein
MPGNFRLVVVVRHMAPDDNKTTQRDQGQNAAGCSHRSGRVPQLAGGDAATSRAMPVSRLTTPNAVPRNSGGDVSATRANSSPVKPKRRPRRAPPAATAGIPGAKASTTSAPPATGATGSPGAARQKRPPVSSDRRSPKLPPRSASRASPGAPRMPFADAIEKRAAANHEIDGASGNTAWRRRRGRSRGRPGIFAG